MVYIVISKYTLVYTPFESYIFIHTSFVRENSNIQYRCMALKQYNYRPRFRSENGHLYIESSTSHNVSFNTKGQGYINVNNENLLQIIGLVF